MARSSADDMDLKRACEAGILSKEKVPEKVALSMRVAKGRVGPPRGLGIAGKLTSRHNQGMAKPRVLAVTSEHFNRSIYRPSKRPLSKKKNLSSIYHACIYPHESSSFFPLRSCGGSQGERAEDQGLPASSQVLQWRNPRGD
jgi:hypothetical protein